jgi:hypothetical protein
VTGREFATCPRNHDAGSLRRLDEGDFPDL